MLLLSFLFAVKAFYLAFWVTPLWDIPDETGHFAYVRDIAEGRGIPLLRNTQIDADIMRHITKNATAKPRANWIAQHPPIYHSVAAVVYKIGGYFTSNVEVLYRLPRIVSVVSGAFLLLVLFQTLLIVGLNTSQATAIAASVGFIPMVSHLSSGTNHDMSLFLFCALATNYFARYLLQRNLTDAYWCALWLAVAGGTKMTAWVLLVPMVAILLIELPGPIKIWARNAAGISIVALSVPSAWMVRNVIHFGNPFYPLGTGAGPRLVEPVAHGFFEYLHTHPVIDHFILNFYGLLGWQGTGGGQVEWFQVDGLPRMMFSILIFVLAGIFVLYMLMLAYRAFRSANITTPPAVNSLLSWAGNMITRQCYSKVLIVPAFLFAILAAGYIGITSHAGASLFGNVRVLAVVMLIFAAFAALALLLFISNPTDRIALYGVVLLLFFGVFVVRQVYKAYLGNGQMRATHGRYFFPVVPILLLSFAIALKRLRMPTITLAVVAASFAYMELETFVLQAVPFYLGESL
jgi:hypothetical protein